MELDKALLKRLQRIDNKQLLVEAQAFKILNRIYSSSKFQRNYNTLLFELKKRGLLK